MTVFRNLGLIIAFTLSAIGCASVKKAPDRAGAIANLDREISAEQNLQVLATKELAAPDENASANGFAAPVPPGIEPQVLTPRQSSDANAFLPLSIALARVSAGAPDNPAELPGRPAPAIDSQSREKALQLYARGRNAALDNRTLQAIVDLQKALELDPTSPQILRELARCYQAESRVPQAVDYYEKLLRLEPDNPEALFALGMASANRRDFARAAAVLAKLRQASQKLNVDPIAAILADFSLSVSLRELGYDRAFIESARAAMNLPDQLAGSAERTARLGLIYRQRGETWRAMGDAHCRLGEYPQALEAYAKSGALPISDPTALHPRIIYANLHLGRIYSAQYELLSAMRAQEKSISDRDIRLCAYLNEFAQPVNLLGDALGAMYRERPEQSALARAAASLVPPEKARAILREYVGRRPRDLDGVWQMLTWLVQQDMATAADLTVTLAGEHTDLADAYADRLAVAAAHPSAALSAIRALPPSAACAHVEARLLLKFGGQGQAWSTCQKARAQWPDDRGLMLQQLQIAAAMHEPGLCEQALATTHGLDDVSGLIGLSQVRRALGQAEQAVRLAQQAVEKEPTSVEAMIELARAQAAHAKILADDPSTKVQARAEVDKAIATAELAIALAPERDEPFEVLWVVYSPGGVLADTKLLYQTLQQLRQTNPQSTLLARIAAQDAINQKRYEQALDRLLNLYENNPSDIASLTQAVTAWQQWGKLDTAEQWLNQRLMQRPGDSDVLEQWVRVELMQSRDAEAVSRLRKAIEADPNDYTARAILEVVYRATGQVEAGRELGEERLLARPQGVRRETELAGLYADVELADKSAQCLQWVQQHAADADLNDLISAINVSGRLKRDEAGQREKLTLDLVQATVERFPTAPLQVYGSGLRSLARLNHLDESFDALVDKAVSNARSADDGSLQGVILWHGLAQALTDEGAPAAAARALRIRLRAPAPLDDNSYALLARFALLDDAAAAVGLNDDTSAATEHAENSLELLGQLSEKGLLPATLNLQSPGRLALAQGVFETSSYYSLIGATSGAERLLHEAVALDPRNAMAFNNLGFMRLEAGDHDEQVVKFIERAYELLPDEPNILDSIGWLRYKQGRFADAPTAQGGGKPQSGALTLIEQSVQEAASPSPAVLDHLGDIHWRLGDMQAATEAWRQVVTLLDDSNFQQTQTRQFKLIQESAWQLVVADPAKMYDREYGQLLERVRQKLTAVEQGGKPPIAPTFDEQISGVR